MIWKQTGQRCCWIGEWLFFCIFNILPKSSSADQLLNRKLCLLAQLLLHPNGPGQRTHYCWRVTKSPASPSFQFPIPNSFWDPSIPIVPTIHRFLRTMATFHSVTCLQGTQNSLQYLDFTSRWQSLYIFQKRIVFYPGFNKHLRHECRLERDMQQNYTYFTNWRLDGRLDSRSSKMLFIWSAQAGIAA